MRSSRGVSSELFLWIFSAIAGALLFLFFIIWSMNHTSTSTTVENIEFARSFEQQLSALSTSNELSKTLTFPKDISLHIACGYFLTGRAREPTSLFVFSPESIIEQQYTLIGKPWYFPFYVDTFYYLIPKQSVVVAYYEPSAASYATSLDVPSTYPLNLLPFSAYSLTSLKRELQGYSSTTLVFFGNAPEISSLLQALRPLPVTVLTVDLQQSLLTYYPEDKTYPFFGEASLLGAFIGKDQYVCQHQRSLEKFRLLATLYQQKTALLQQKLGPGSSCQQYLSQGGSLLTTLSAPLDPERLRATVTSLTAVNEDLLRHDCPTIY